MGFASTTTLCICMLTHSYLLISVFPYSGFLVIDLVNDTTVVNQDNVGSLSGLLCSAFMFGRALTSVAWGQVADIYGRMFVLYASLILSCLLSLAFGLAPTLPTAIAVRFAMGCANGIMSSLKTIVSESSLRDEKTETRNMSLVIGMWGFGFLLSPVLSGALSEPLKLYPNADFLKSNWVGDILETYPFLLPNLLGALFCLVTTVMLWLFVSETLETARHPRHIPADICHSLHGCCRSLSRRKNRYYRKVPATLKEHPSDLFDDTTESDIENDVADNNKDNALNKVDEEHSSRRTTNKDKEPLQLNNKKAGGGMADIWARRDTRTLLWIYWAFSFISITIDEAFPLFAISHQAGFDVTEKEIGRVLSLCGLLFVLSQYCVTVCLYDRFGLLGSIRAGTTFNFPMVFLLPLSVLINKGAPSGTLKISTYLFLACVMALYRVFSLCFFTNISVMVNRSVPPTLRGTINGLSQVGGSVAKGLGPAFAGVLVSASVSLVGRAASVLIFGTIGCIGVCVTISTYVFLRDIQQCNDGDEEETEEESIEDDDDDDDDDDAEIELTPSPSVLLRSSGDEIEGVEMELSSIPKVSLRP